MANKKVKIVYQCYNCSTIEKTMSFRNMKDCEWAFEKGHGKMCPYCQSGGMLWFLSDEDEAQVS